MAQEQDRSEDPTPFKLKKARERGQVARSVEIGFLGGLAGLVAFFTLAGRQFAVDLRQAMSLSLSAGIARAGEPESAQHFAATLVSEIVEPLALLGGTVVLIVLFLELVQLRGFVLSAEPLKPDWSRLNPAQGLKRLISARLLKETLKSLLKAIAYATATCLLIRAAVHRYAIAALDAERLPPVMRASGTRLALAFLLLAIAFVALDQVLVRRTFHKQMRMSRREVVRETRDREGDARIKQRRKQLHAEFVRQSQGIGALAGSDMVIVNPEHFAVALSYDRTNMAAPMVKVKGRNRLALDLKARAMSLGIPIIRQPTLARSLFKNARIGKPIPTTHYRAVAELYFELYARQRSEDRPG